MSVHFGAIYLDKNDAVTCPGTYIRTYISVHGLDHVCTCHCADLGACRMNLDGHVLALLALTVPVKSYACGHLRTSE